MPNHSETDQPRFSTGGFVRRVKHQAHQLPQRHSSAVYPVSMQAVYSPTALLPATGILIFYVFLAIAIVSAASMVTRKLIRRRPTGVAQYRCADSLLTPTEAKFYRALDSAVGPMAVIQCKVRLADILLAPERDLAAFRRVSQKHVDFVLCERVTLKPLLAVELDDPSHARPDRIQRDQFVDAAYASAGLPIVHIPTQRDYNHVQLLTTIQPHIIVSQATQM